MGKDFLIIAHSQYTHSSMNVCDAKNQASNAYVSSLKHIFVKVAQARC